MKAHGQGNKCQISQNDILHVYEVFRISPVFSQFLQNLNYP